MVKLPGPIEAEFQRMQEMRNPAQAAAAPGVEDTEDPSQAPDETQVAVQAEPQQKAVPNEDTPEFWKKRYSGYKEQSDQTIYELRKLVAKNDTDRALAQHSIEQLQARIQELESVAPKSYIPPGVLSEEDLDTLGEDNATRIAKIVNAQIERQKKEYEQRLGVLTSKLNEREQQEVAQAEIRSNNDFWAKVREIVPDANEIDVDPRFAEFLNAADKFSGRTRRELGTSAKNSWDVQRMASIYSEFKSSIAPPSREEQVTPRGSGAANEPGRTNTGARIWTQKEYQQAVHNTIRGGPPTPEKMAKVDKIHAEFLNALREGRVRG